MSKGPNPALSATKPRAHLGASSEIWFCWLAEDATAQDTARTEHAAGPEDATSTEHAATAAPLDTPATPLDTELAH